MSDMWNEMFAAPHSVDEEYDETWPYNFKWGFDPDTGRVDVWRVQGGVDGRPTHRREIEERWGRKPSVQAGDVMGLATYIPAEIKIDGTIVAPPEVHTQTYYDKPTPPQVVQYFQEQFPHAVVRDAIIARSKGQVFGKTASEWDFLESGSLRVPDPVIKWIWNEKNGTIVWEADSNNDPTHNQKALAEWGRQTSLHTEGDTIGYAFPDPEKVEIESYDKRPIPPAAFAAVKSQLAEWYPNHQIIGDNQEQREFGSDPVDYRSAALTWAWENLSDDLAERSHSSSETTVRRPGLLARLFRKRPVWRKTAEADMEGCMVALFVPEQAAKKLRPRGGEDIENMHITLLYFKDEARERDDWDEVKKLVEQIANQHPILRGTVSGYGVFNSDEGDVLWASPSVQGLAELRHKLYEACTDAGFTIDSEHDWVPHITLKYDHRGKLPQPDEEISLSFDELSFAQGEKQRHYEFKGHLEKTTMAERSGDPELDALIEQFLQEEHDYIDMYRQSENAERHCVEVSEFFASWLTERGVKADIVADEFTLREIGLYDPQWRGEPLDPDDPDVFHTFTIVQMPSGIYGVDWTASQFGYAEFPMVQKEDGSNFQREWGSEKRAALPSRKPGQQLYFEYHCHEGHDSGDAHLWYRSHQPVTVVSPGEDSWGNGPDEEIPEGWNSDIRAEWGAPRTYQVRFEDGYEDQVFEDELVDSPVAYHRPDPPVVTDPARLVRQGSAAPEPPNYRKQEKPSETCGLCKMMSDGKCWGYGNRPVEPDMVCDSFSPETKKTSAADLPDWAHQPGVWYHVTSEDRLPQIAKEGLRPDTDARRFEHDYSPGVYLFGMPEQAYNWYRPEEWNLPIVLLRITGIPEDQITPDPEMVQDYKEGEWQEMVEGSQPWWQHEQVVYQGTIPPEQIEWTYQTKEVPFQKLAAGQVMYHVAPVSARESILQNGLDTSKRSASPWSNVGVDYPEGNYLWLDAQNAEEYCHTIGKPDESFDIWAVNTDGLQLQADPEADPTGVFDQQEWDEEEWAAQEANPESYVYLQPIEPDRLKLVDTVEAQDWEDRYGKTSSEDYLDWSGWEGAHRFVTDGKEILTDPETERINDSQWRDSELEDKFRTIYPEAKSFVSGWIVPTADGMGLGIWAPAAGHGDKHEPGLHEIIGVVEKELGKPAHLITNEEHLSDEGMYDPGIETTWQTLSRRLTKPS